MGIHMVCTDHHRNQVYIFHNGHLYKEINKNNNKNLFELITEILMKSVSNRKLYFDFLCQVHYSHRATTCSENKAVDCSVVCWIHPGEATAASKQFVVVIRNYEISLPMTGIRTTVVAMKVKPHHE